MKYYIFGTNETSRVMFSNLKRQQPNDFIGDDDNGFQGLVVDPEFLTAPPAWLEDSDIGLSKKRVLPFMKIMLNPHDLRCGIYLPIYDNKLRAKKFDQAVDWNIRPLTFIDNRAMIDEDVEIGDGCWVQMGAYVQSGAYVGSNTVLWGLAWLGHNCSVMSNCFISSGSVVCGNATIKEGSYLGVNTAVKENVTIEEGSILGMGALITKNLPSGTYLAGVNNLKK